MAQYISGYCLECVRKLLLAHNDPKKVQGLLKYLSHFELDTSIQLTTVVDNPVFSVIDNIISRGEPSHPSVYVEEYVSQKLNFAQKKITKIGDIVFEINQNNCIDANILFNALHIVDPRIKRSDLLQNYKKSWEQLDSGFEEDFLYKNIPEIFGTYFCQLLESQREFTTIIKDSADFTRQRVDFAIEYPYPVSQNNKKGLVFEIDGPHHSSEQQAHLDIQRDRALTENNWSFLRIKTSDFKNINTILSKFKRFTESTDYFKILNNNFNKPLYDDNNAIIALQLCLTPFLIARIQKTLITLLKAGILKLDQKWRIAILERDVPCAFLAIDDFRNILENILFLRTEKIKLPEFELKIYNTKEFASCTLNSDREIELYSDNIVPFNADIVIDVSILQRSKTAQLSSIFLQKLNNPDIIKIHSAFAPIVTYRLNHSSQPIKYLPLVENEYVKEIKGPKYYDERVKKLQYFLQTIFRKEKFRPGQIEILNRALQQLNIIGLLPTGAGKSLCYQLSALLQPGITIVVDPLLSLMKDQIQNLETINIIRIARINSELSAIKKAEVTERMKEGLYQFVFIAPERMQIQNFRDALEEIRQNNITIIHQFVIDEAHCVSEWGHDFRPAYLNLGKNAREFIGENILIFGLTGTASFDVLSDVAREVKLHQQDVIETASFNRPELKFSIQPKRWKQEQADSTQKLAILKRVLMLIPRYFNKSPQDFYSTSYNNFYENCGIIFCPHGKIENNERSPYSVGYVKHLVQEFLNSEHLNSKVELYSGSLNDKERELSQDKFKNSQTQILVATQAFGMGIDKLNIRFIIHYSCSQSIESYYQEAGRAGRDLENALCITIFSDDKIFLKKTNNQYIFSSLNLFQTLQINEIKQYLGFESQGKEMIRIQGDNIELNYEGPIDEYTFINHTNFYLNRSRSHNEILAIPKAEFKISNDIHRRVYFHDINFPGFYKEKGIFNGVLQYIIPALNNNQPSVIIPFLIQTNYSDENDRMIQLILDDRPSTMIEEKQIRNSKNNGWVERGIYHLSLLGVVTNYVKNYNENNYLVYINQLEDIELINNAKTYVSQYKSESYVNTVENTILNYPLPNIENGDLHITLFKSVYFLIQFIYSEIEKKRRNALREYTKVIRIGSENIKRFQDELDSYFNSKFIKELEEFARTYSIEILWEYIDRCGDNKDELRHLHGAVVRLLITYDENLLFQIIRSYTSFVHPDYDKTEAIEFFLSGFEKAENSTELNNPERSLISDWIAVFINRVERLEPNVVPYINVALEKYHINWLEKLNSKLIPYATSD